jgi:hypothetical protein
MTLRIVAFVLACTVVLAGCSPSDDQVRFEAKRALLERQNQGVRELIDEEREGKLVPPDQFLVGIDDDIVAELFRLELPLERPLGKHFNIRLEKATVSFKDKYGSIVVEGSMFRPETPDRKTAVVVHGGLGKVSIDPKSGLLQIKIAVDDIQLVSAGILDPVLGNAGKKLIAQTGKAKLEEALPTLQVPVALAQNITVPAIQQGSIQLDKFTIPLDVSVNHVFAASGKLWVTFEAKVGTITGAETGLGVKVGKKAKKT